jgi:hypothetical protein
VANSIAVHVFDKDQVRMIAHKGDGLFDDPRIAADAIVSAIGDRKVARVEVTRHKPSTGDVKWKRTSGAA